MNKKILGHITQAMIKKKYKYYPLTGDLVLRKNDKLVNKTRNSKVYSKCRINGSHVQVHQIVFLGAYGYLPEMVDHINGDRGDNRLENLRDSNKHHNQWNVEGLGYHLTEYGTWRVQKKIMGKNTSFGTFKTEAEAKAKAEEIQLSLINKTFNQK